MAEPITIPVRTGAEGLQLTVALERSARVLDRSSLPARCHGLRPHLDVVARPLRAA